MHLFEHYQPLTPHSNHRRKLRNHNHSLRLTRLVKEFALKLAVSNIMDLIVQYVVQKLQFADGVDDDWVSGPFL